MASLNELDDFQSLLQDALNDPVAFTTLANRIRELVLPSLTSKVFGDSSQQDVFQEILAAVSQQLSTLVTREDPECFVQAIARNKITQYRRHQVTGSRKLLRYDSDAVSNSQSCTSTIDSVERNEEYARLEKFILALPSELREILELRFWKEQTLAEIGQAIGAPVHVVKYRLQTIVAAAEEWFADK